MTTISSDNSRPDFTDGKDQPEKAPAESSSPVGSKIPPELVKKLNSEMTFLSKLDEFALDPFQLIFQDKLLAQYRNAVWEPVLEDNENLRQEFESKQILNTVNDLKKAAENIALKHDIKQNLEGKLRKINLILLVVMAVPMVMVFIPDLQAYANFFLLAAILIYCALPSIMKQVYSKKWAIFIQTAMPELEQAVNTKTNNIQQFCQALVYDMRDKLIAINYPLKVVRFALRSNQYQGLKLVQSSLAEKRPVYVFEFEYPAGMEPIQPTGAKSVLPEDLNTKDLFASFKIEQFEGENIKEYTFKYIPEEQYDKVNEMLNGTTFSESKQAREFIKDANKFNLMCKCGEKLSFKDCQLCSLEKQPDLHFFFATGEKCKSGDITYLLCADPKDTPADFKDIFI